MIKKLSSVCNIEVFTWTTGKFQLHLKLSCAAVNSWLRNLVYQEFLYVCMYVMLAQTSILCSCFARMKWMKETKTAWCDNDISLSSNVLDPIPCHDNGQVSKALQNFTNVSDLVNWETWGIIKRAEREANTVWVTSTNWNVFSLEPNWTGPLWTGIKHGGSYYRQLTHKLPRFFASLIWADKIELFRSQKASLLNKQV